MLVAGFIIMIVIVAIVNAQKSSRPSQMDLMELEKQQEIERVCGPWFKVVGGEFMMLSEAELEERMECRQRIRFDGYTLEELKAGGGPHYCQQIDGEWRYQPVACDLGPSLDPGYGYRRADPNYQGRTPLGNNRRSRGLETREPDRHQFTDNFLCEQPDGTWIHQTHPCSEASVKHMQEKARHIWERYEQ